MRRRTLDNNRQVTKHAVFRSLHTWQRALRGTWDICNGFSPADLRSEHRNIRPLSREVPVPPDPARRVSAAPAPKPPPRTRKSGENGALRLQVRLLHPTTGSKSRPFCNSDRDVSTVQHSMDAYGCLWTSPIRVGVDNVFPAVRPLARILPGEFDAIHCLLRG